MPAAAAMPTYLFVLPWSLAHPGRVNDAVVELAREMQQRGLFRPVVLVADWSAVVPVWETVRGIATVRWRLRPETGGASPKARLAQALWRLRFAPAFQRFCAEHRVAVVNPHYATPTAFTLQRLAAAARPALPLVVSFHGADVAAIERGPAAERARWRRLAGRARAFVAGSQALARRLADALGHGVAPTVVHPGLDADAFVALAGPEVPPAAPRRRLLSVGPFAPGDAERALVAFARLRPAFPDLELVLAAVPVAALPALQSQAAALGVADALRLHAEVPPPQRAGLFRDASVFVLPARQDLVGPALLEAGSFALPVVASPLGGVPELLDDGETGRLVPPDDPAALVAAIAALLADPGIACAMGHRLRAQVRSRFTWAAALDRYAALAAPAPAAVPARGRPAPQVST